MVLLNKSYAVESELSEATRNGKVCMYLKSYRENHAIDRILEKNLFDETKILCH